MRIASIPRMVARSRLRVVAGSSPATSACAAGRLPAVAEFGCGGSFRAEATAIGRGGWTITNAGGAVTATGTGDESTRAGAADRTAGLPGFGREATGLREAADRGVGVCRFARVTGPAGAGAPAVTGAGSAIAIEAPGGATGGTSGDGRAMRNSPPPMTSTADPATAPRHRARWRLPAGNATGPSSPRIAARSSLSASDL